MNALSHRVPAAAAAAAVVLALAGCADADIAAMRDRASNLANAGMAKIAPPAPVVPPEVVAYDAWTRHETQMLDKLTTTVIAPAGRTWEYQPGDVTYQYHTTPGSGPLTRAAFKPPTRFLVDLPADAVIARAGAAGELVQQLAELTADRSVFEPSVVAVEAPSPADRAWLRQQAAAGLARVKSTRPSIRIVEIAAAAYRVGFIADAAAPVVRTVATVPSTPAQ